MECPLIDIKRLTELENHQFEIWYHKGIIYSGKTNQCMLKLFDKKIFITKGTLL